jgi:tetratricopeptide (TPR) repeat protein
VKEQDVLLSRFRTWINVTAPAAVFTAIAALILTCPLDDRIFTHLAAGDRILGQRSVPHAEEFSYTAFGLPWTDLSWLYQAGVAGVRRAGGLGAVGALHVLAWMAIFAGLFARGRRFLPAPVRAAVVLAAAVGCAPWLRPGPEVVSWGLLLLTLALLERAGEPLPGSRLVLWGLLPGLVLLWVNLHQGFLLALLATALVAVDRAMSAFGRRARASGRSTPSLLAAADLAFSLALQCGAALLGPFGARALRLPFDTVLDPLGVNPLFGRLFDDWRPALGGGLGTPQWIALGLLVAAAVVVLLRSPGPGRAAEAVLLLLLLVMALRSRRHLPPLMIAAAFVALRHRPAPSPGEARPAAASGRVAAAVGAAGLFVAALVAFAALRPSGWPPATRPAPSFLPAADEFPEASARFVDAANLPGQVFHSLTVSGYLVDTWKRDRRIFADERREPFEHGVLRTWLEAAGDDEAFERVVDKYQITTVLWPHRDAERGAVLLRHLAAGGRWRLVSLDTAASVWVRVDALTPALAKEAPIPMGSPLAPLVPVLTAQLAARPRPGPPLREADLAAFFAAAGDAAGAEAFFRMAAAKAPRTAALWRGLGEALAARGERGEARDAFERSDRLDRRDGRASAALGRIALEEGNLNEARLRLDAAARAGDERASTLAARGLLAEREERADDARFLFAAALRQDGADPDVLLAAAGFEGRHGDLEKALSLYGRVQSRRPDDPAAAAGAATLLEGAGREAEALDVARGPAEGAASRAAAAGRVSPEDRRLLEVAAKLARRAGENERAAEWEKAMGAAAPGVTPGR